MSQLRARVLSAAGGGVGDRAQWDGGRGTWGAGCGGAKDRRVRARLGARTGLSWLTEQASPSGPHSCLGWTMRLEGWREVRGQDRPLSWPLQTLAEPPCRLAPAAAEIIGS